jgi:hypothetical protein
MVVPRGTCGVSRKISDRGTTTMGMRPFPAKMLGKVPTYYITDVLQEDAGNGNVRVWNCTRRNGVLIPQFEVIVPAASLMMVGRKVANFAQDIFNDLQLRELGTKVH